VPASGDLIIGGAYRGHLTSEGSTRVAPLVGTNVDRFDGRIVTVLDTAYLVAMSATVKSTDPRPTIWSGEQLVIPKAAVNKFELRMLDRPKTIRAVALYSVGVLVAGGLFLSISGIVSGSNNPPPVIQP
jgi:hypothetical protein